MTAGRVVGLSAAVAVPAVVLMLFAVVAALGTSLVGSMPGSATLSCRATGGSTTALEGYSPDQLANAATIIAVGKQLDIPAQGQVIAIATAMQESGLRNLDYGDRDSVGLFQQRPSQGWGTPAQLTD